MAGMDRTDNCAALPQSCRIEAHIVSFFHESALCVHKTRIRIEIVRSYSIRVLLVPRWHQDAIGSLDTGSATLNHAGLEQFSSVWIMRTRSACINPKEIINLLFACEIEQSGLLFGSFWSWDSSRFVKIWHQIEDFPKSPNFGRLLFCVQTPVEARTGFVETPHVSSIDSCSFYGSGYRSDNVFNRIKLAIFRKTSFLGTE